MSATRNSPRQRPALALRWPRRPGMAVLVGVLALHAMLLLWATRLGVWPDRVIANAPAPASASASASAPGAPLILWWPDGRAGQPAPVAVVTDRSTPARQRPHAVTVPSTASKSAPAAPAARAEPQAITLPPASAGTTTGTAPAAAVPALAASAPPPLNLALPRAPAADWRLRSPALDDPRANSRAPINMATLIEKVLGGDPSGAVSEEHLADGSVRFRRGGKCVMARPNQAQNIDPFNASVFPKPRLLDRC